MGGHRNGDSRSPHPRTKHRSRRSSSRSLSRSPVKEVSRSPSPGLKRPRRQHEENAVWGHLKGSDRARDKDHSRREKDEGRGRDRERDEDRFISRGRDRDGRDIDRHPERSRERDRDRERNRYRDRDKDRDRDRDKDRERDRDRGRDKDPDHGREKGEKGRDDRREAGHRRSPTRAHSAKSASPTSEYETHTQPSPRKINMSSSPVKARIAATAMGNEAIKNHDTENRFDDAGDSLAKMNVAEAALQERQKSKEKPSFEYSGKLAAETNKVRGVTLRFTEPPEARKPTIRWRLYIFKDGEPLGEPLYIHRLSCYLFGRERRVADVPTDHPSCSKQHAVVQYRLVEKIAADGTTSSEVKPYLMDLGSTNGTFINGERIEPERYYELFEKDTIKFGNSSREYVLLHEHSAG